MFALSLMLYFLLEAIELERTDCNYGVESEGCFTVILSLVAELNFHEH